MVTNALHIPDMRRHLLDDIREALRKMDPTEAIEYPDTVKFLRRLRFILPSGALIFIDRTWHYPEYITECPLESLFDLYRICVSEPTSAVSFAVNLLRPPEAQENTQQENERIMSYESDTVVLRKKLLNELREALCKCPYEEGIYEPGPVRFLGPLKYLRPDGTLTYTNSGLQPHYLLPDHIDECPLEALMDLREICVAATPAGRIVPLSEVLTDQEIGFVRAVLGNPDGKNKDTWSHSTEQYPSFPLYKRPEELGLITCTGSYRWVPTGKLVMAMRVTGNLQVSEVPVREKEGPET